MSADNLPPGTHVVVERLPYSPLVGGGTLPPAQGVIVEGTPPKDGGERVYVKIDGKDNDIPVERVKPA